MIRGVRTTSVAAWLIAAVGVAFPNPIPFMVVALIVFCFGGVLTKPRGET